MENKPDFKILAEAVGVTTYPEVFEQVYAQLPDALAPACDLKLIDRLQAEHDLFGEFYGLIREAAEAVNADPLRSAWVRIASDYALTATVEQARLVPTPKPDGTAVTDFLMFYILLPQIPGSIDSYRNRGFTESELENLLGAYKSGMRIVEQQTGRPGVNQTYYHWLTLFSKASIFKTEGLQFELRQLPGVALWLRSRETKQLVPLMLNDTFHASGVQPLGSFGYQEETGAFTPTFTEDDENYYGHGVFDGVVDSQSRAFSKARWECVGRPGDPCLGMHIPRGADISREAVEKACASARKIALERYPEYGAKHVFCASWLLNPRLKELQGPQSRITQFMECFTKYPNKDTSGSAVFSFVFVRKPENLEDLPEDTSLRRKLKKIYLDGDCIHIYSGLIFMED